MVVFKDDPEKYNTPEMFLKLQQDISKVMDLHKQIAINEESIMLNPLVSWIILDNRIPLLIYYSFQVCKKVYWESRRWNW